jgi:hypothetical protein
MKQFCILCYDNLLASLHSCQRMCLAMERLTYFDDRFQSLFETLCYPIKISLFVADFRQQI